MLSSIVLGVSGFALLWHSTEVAKMIISIGGGYTGRAYIHRIAAIILIFDGLWHLLYILFSKDAHNEFLKIIPSFSDFKELAKAVSYYLSNNKEFPKFKKFNFIQKFQYWGVVLGMMIMILSGLALWFKDISMMILPKWAMDVLLTLHGREGLLAFLVLFLWHQYNVHLNPSVFPMDKIWLTGRISEDRLKKEHYLEYEEIIKTNLN